MRESPSMNLGPTATDLHASVSLETLPRTGEKVAECVPAFQLVPWAQITFQFFSNG